MSRLQASVPGATGRPVAANASPADYALIFRKAPTPMMVVDTEDLRILAVNEAVTRALGYGEGELVGASFRAFVALEDREALARLLEAATVPGVMEARSWWTVTRRNQGPLRVEAYRGPLLFAGRRAVLLFHPPDAEPTSRDVATRSGDLSEFSFSALHDLKEPLNLIKGYLALLRSRSQHELSPESQEFLDYAYGGTQRLQALVHNLLEYLRADVKGVQPEPVDLGQTWDDALEGLRLQVREAEARVTRDALPTLMVDRAQLGRVLQNLLGNALKFRSAAAATVHASARRVGDAWEIAVEDNGIGIAPKDQERVLQPFQRVHSTDKYPGTGLGLSISKKIVEMHGGRLWLDSTPGQGTTVRFTLPAAAPAAARGA